MLRLHSEVSLTQLFFSSYSTWLPIHGGQFATRWFNLSELETPWQTQELSHLSNLCRKGNWFSDVFILFSFYGVGSECWRVLAFLWLRSINPFLRWGFHFQNGRKSILVSHFKCENLFLRTSGSERLKRKSKAGLSPTGNQRPFLNIRNRQIQFSKTTSVKIIRLLMTELNFACHESHMLIYLEQNVHPSFS